MRRAIANNVTLSQCTLTNTVQATWIGGTITSSFCKVFNFGIFDVPADSVGQAIWTSDHCEFNNDNTLSSENAQTILGIPFFNNAFVEANAGTLRFGTSTGAGTDNTATGGTFTVAQGAVLQFASNFGMDATSSVSGQGTVQVVQIDSIPNVTLAGTYTAAITKVTGGYLVIANGATYSASMTEISGSGTLTMNGTGTTTQGLLSGGALDGTGTFTINQIMTWTGGAMNGAGQTVVAGNATMLLMPAVNTVTLDLNDRKLVNSGTIYVSPGTQINATDSTIQNDAGARFAMSGTATVSGAGATFNNKGTVQNLSWNPSVTTALDIYFNNICMGKVNVPAGTLRFGNGGDATTSSVILGDGVTLEFSGWKDTFNFSGTINPEIILKSSGGIVNFSDPNNSSVDVLDMQIAGGIANFAAPVDTSHVEVVRGIANFNGAFYADELTITGGRANFNGTATSPDVLLRDGTLGGSGTFTITDNFDWIGGKMSGAGTTEVNPDAVLILGDKLMNNMSFMGLEDTRRLNNQGAIRTEGSSTISSYGTPSVYDYGTFEVEDDTLAIDAQFNVVATTVSVDDGTLVLRGGGSCEAGTFALSGDATLAFDRVGRNSPTFAFDTCSQILGTAQADDEGIVSFQGGTVTFDGTLYNVYATNIAGGEVDFNKSDDVPDDRYITGDLILGANSANQPGILSGNGTIQVTSSFKWSGGTMTGGGITWIKDGAKLMVAGGALGIASNRTINNQGQAFFYYGAAVNFTGGVVFQNRGPLVVSDNVLINGSGTGNILNNYSSIQRIGLSTGTSIINVLFNNVDRAQVSIDCGSLVFEAGWKAAVNQGDQGSAGTWIIRVGGDLVLGSLTTPTAEYNFTSNTIVQFLPVLPGLNVSAGATLNPGQITVAGGIMWLAQSSSNEQGRVPWIVPNLVLLNGGQITGPGLLEVTNRMVWMGGSMVGNTDGSGATSIMAGATLYVIGTVSLNRTLNISTRGWYVWVGGGAVVSTDNGPFQNNQVMKGPDIPANSVLSNPGAFNTYLNGLQKVAGYGPARTLAETLQAILQGNTANHANLGYMGHPKSSATQHRKNIPLSKLGSLDIVSSLF